MCVQCWAAIAAAAHTYSNIIPVQRRGACLSRDGPRKKYIYLNIYRLERTTIAEPRPKVRGVLWREDNTLIVFPTQRATQHTDGVFRVD